MNTSMSGKKVLAVFAHPDDESFGPGGTIALWAEQGAEIHMLVATNGDHDKMGHIREKELAEAAEVLGVIQVTHLGFQDGCICNIDLQMLEGKITEKIQAIKPDMILTFNLNGVSGHMDHIALASATTKAFRTSAIAEKLYYYTQTRDHSDQMQDYFINFPDGIDPKEADEIIDVSSVWEKRLTAMSKHESQKHDMERILRLYGDTRDEYYMILHKKTSQL